MQLTRKEINDIACAWMRQSGVPADSAEDTVQHAFADLFAFLDPDPPAQGTNPLPALCGPEPASMALSAMRLKRFLAETLKERLPDTAARVPAALDNLLEHALENPGPEQGDSLLSDEEYVRNLVRNAHEVIFLVDQHGIIVSVNQAVLHLVGYPPGQATGSHISTFLDEQNLAIANRVLNETIANRFPDMPVELEVLHKDGGRRVIQYNARPLTLRNGKTVAQCVARDITLQHSLRQELQQERDKLRLIVQSMGAGLAMVDSQYHVTWMNDTVREWFPEHVDEEPLTCYRLFFGAGEPCALCLFHDCMASGKPARAERFFSRATTQSSGCYYLFSAAPMFDAQGSITHILEMVQDVTQPHITHEKAHFWHEFFTKVVHNAPVGIVTLEPSGNVLTWNRYMERTYDFQTGDVVGKNLFEIFPRLVDEGFRNWLDQVIRTREPVTHFNWRHQSLNAGDRIIEIMLYPLLDESGDLVGVAFINNDVTERRLMQEELHQAKDFLGSLFNAVTDYVFVVGTDGVILDVNRATEDIFHYSMDDLKGREWKTLFRMPGECDVLIEGLLRKARIDFMELELVESGGGVRHVIQSAAVITNSAGDPEALAVIGKDITEFKDMQERMLRVQRLNALGELASGVAHDFNNMLAVILGRSQLMLKQSKDPAIAKGLEVVQRAARHGAETVKRIQSFARRRTGDEQFEEVDLSAIVAEAVEFTRSRWMNDMKRAGAAVELEMQATPGCTIMGNAHELIEVFTNMILNAVDAMPEGGVLRLETKSRDGMVLATVSDTGTGMPLDVRRRIFDPFFTTKGFKGTGLGLSVSYGIVERHGGRIEVDTEPGRGATFHVCLPSRELFLSRHARARAGARGPLILVVDDEVDVLDLIVEILKFNGFEVKSASDGQEACDLLERESFDIIFTDMRMPGMDGWDVVRKARDRNPDVFVALVTAWFGQIGETDMSKYKIDAVIQKPFQESDILNALPRMEPPAGTGA